MISEESKSKLRRLMELREKRDEKKRALEVAEGEYREHEADVFEALESLRDPADPSSSASLKVPLGEPWGTVRFNTRETHYGNVFDEEAAVEYFEQRAMLDEVSAPKLVKRRINEIVRDAVEQNADLPPGVDYYTQRGVTITRQKG